MLLGPRQWTALALLLLATRNWPTTAAKRFVMRPLNDAEVYLLLYEAGRADAVPEGRIVTQGLAAIGGLATGLTRRIIGGGTRRTLVSTQEICFETRQARSLQEAEDIMDAVVRADGGELLAAGKRQRTRSSGVGRILKLKRRKKLRQDERHKGNKRIKNRGTQYMSAPALGSRTGTNTNTDMDSADTLTYSTPVSSSLTANPTTTATVTSSGSTQTTNPTTTMGTDLGTGTTSTLTTETSPEGAINCIVIRKSE